MPASAITQPDDRAAAAPAWYPFASLAGPLDQLHGQCAGLASDVARLIRDGQATIDALTAETEQDFQRLRQAHQIIRDLDPEQSMKVLRGIREQARPPRPPTFHLALLAKELRP